MRSENLTYILSEEIDRVISGKLPRNEEHNK